MAKAGTVWATKEITVPDYSPNYKQNIHGSIPMWGNDWINKWMEEIRHIFLTEELQMIYPFQATELNFPPWVWAALSDFPPNSRKRGKPSNLQGRNLANTSSARYWRWPSHVESRDPWHDVMRSTLPLWHPSPKAITPVEPEEPRLRGAL